MERSSTSMPIGRGESAFADAALLPIWQDNLPVNLIGGIEGCSGGTSVRDKVSAFTELLYDLVSRPRGPAPEQDCVSRTACRDVKPIQFDGLRFVELRDVRDQGDVELKALRFK